MSHEERASGYELIKEKIALDHRIGRETTQVLLEGDLIVPDVKPDMAVVLQTDAKVLIDRVDAGSDRVNFVGKMEVQILYLAKGSEKPVHSMGAVTQIDDFLNMDGVSKEAWVEATADIANVEYKMMNDRKISYRAVVDITVLCEKTIEHEVVMHIKDVPSDQLLKNNLTLSRRVENKTDRFHVKDDLVIPAGKPAILEILQCNAVVANKEVRTQNGRASVSAELVVTTLYRGDNDSNLIEFAEHEVPFNGSVELGVSKDEMTADITLFIQDQYVHVRADADGEDRVIELEVTLGVIAKVHGQESFDILEDAHCINKRLKMTKAPIRYPKAVCRNKNQTPIKEVVQLDEQCPDILQIFSVKGRARVDDTKIIADKVVVEGIVEAEALYVAENDQTPLYCYKTIIPYRQTIETKGSSPMPDLGMMASVDAGVDHVSFNMLSGREMELRFLLSFNTQVTREIETNMITGISFEDMDKAELDSTASMTVYVAQKGDVLWKVAKKYNTSVDELMLINDIEDPHKLIPGQKLLILKRVC